MRLEGFVILVPYHSGRSPHVITPREGAAVYGTRKKAEDAKPSRTYNSDARVVPATLTIHESESE